VVEVPFDALDGLAVRLREEEGFELAPQHFALSGRCRDCRAAGQAPGTGIASAPPR
jgi:Fur family ferric uptake transcriptional regulator